MKPFLIFRVFTLIELLVVVAIIASLAAIAIPHCGLSSEAFVPAPRRICASAPRRRNAPGCRTSLRLLLMPPAFARRRLLASSLQPAW